MPRRLIDSGGGRLLLDIASYARRGPSRRDRLSQDEIELISRTVGRIPEVMVKVLSRGGQDLKAVGRHLAYLNRWGDVEIETDDGRTLSGKAVEKELLEDWDLDLEVHRRTVNLESRPRRAPPKLVHKLMFSMPAGTPPEKVLAAVKSFAREEFGLEHRYAMVLHTDEPHPHVHMVVKAVSEEGMRLNIRKTTLRNWRREFARHLREEGVAANATERAARGEVKPQKSDGIFRAALRDASTHWRRRAEVVAQELAKGGLNADAGKERVRSTRHLVKSGWREIASRLVMQDQVELASAVRNFVARMAPPLTEKEQLAERIRERSRTMGEQGSSRE